MVLSKKNLTIVIVVAVVVIIGSFKFMQSRTVVKVDAVAARTTGPEQAKVKIIEFIDFECPACAYGAGKLKEYMARYPGAIHLEVKYYPLLNVHRHALQASTYIECVARQGKFWPFFNSMMTQQSQWSPLVNVEGVFNQMAQGAGVNIDQLKQCLPLEDVSAAIMNEKSVGRSMGVQSTPTYFINNKMVVGGKSLMDELNNYFPPSK